MLRKFRSVRQILDAAYGSLNPIANILMFMLLILIVFGCLGMQLYGSKFQFLVDEHDGGGQGGDKDKDEHPLELLAELDWLVLRLSLIMECLLSWLTLVPVCDTTSSRPTLVTLETICSNSSVK